MMQETHLNSEQLENLMSAAPDPKLTRHVEACPACAAELASLQNVLGNFRTAATASARHHRYLAPTAGARRVPRVAWAFCMAALAIAVGTPIAVHQRQVVRGEDAPAVTDASAMSPQTQSPALSDEALLSGVQNDLSASVPEPLLPLSSTNKTSNSTDKE